MFWSFVIFFAGLTWLVHAVTGISWLYSMIFPAILTVLAVVGLFVSSGGDEDWADRQERENRYKLDGSKITVEFSRENRDEGRVTLEITDATVRNNSKGRTLHSIRGINVDTGAYRTIRGERLTLFYDAETGEVIENLLVYVLAHRQK